MKKLITSIMFILFMMINVVSYGALSLGETFTYDSSYTLPPHVFDGGDLLLCARSHTNLNRGNSYTRQINSEDIDSKKIAYIVSETRRTGKYYLNGTLVNGTGKYTAGAQQVAFWETPWEAKENLKNGASTADASARLSGDSSAGQNLKDEAGTIETYFNDFLDSEGNLKNVEAKKEDNFNIFANSQNKTLEIGPISVKYPYDTRTDERLIEISEIKLLDAEGNDLGPVDVKGMSKKTSGKGTEYWDIESDKEFYIIYTPANGDLTVPAVQIQINFLHLSGFKDAKYSGYDNDSSALGQPLMNVYAIDEWKESNCKVEGGPSNEDELDLSLKKMIYSIDGNKINNEITVDFNTVKSGSSDDAKYTKKYDNKTVKIGKEVVFRLYIYNEGTKAGRALKIVDTLPAGLEYVRIENNEGYDAEANGQVITLTANEKLNNIDPYKMAYVDVVCKVSDDVLDKAIGDDKRYDLSLDVKDVEINDDKEVIYTIEIKNDGQEDATVQKIKHTLPDGIEFVEDKNEGWTVEKKTDGTTECYKEINEKITKGNKKEEKLTCKLVKNEDKTLESTSEIISMKEEDISKNDWRKVVYINFGESASSSERVERDGVFVDDEKETTNKDKLTLTQTITGIHKKGENDLEELDDGTKQVFKVNKGDIIEYTIKVECDEQDGDKVQIVNILPDGLEMIPTNEDDVEDLADETDNDDINDYERKNELWETTNAKNTIKTIKNDNDVKIGKKIKLYCVVTTDKETKLKNIAEIISEHDNVTSEPDNVDVDSYNYEKQESDDDWCEVITYANDGDEEKTAKLNVDIEIIEKKRATKEVYYNIKVKNEGEKSTKVKKLNITLEGVTHRRIDDYAGFDDGRRTIGKSIILSKDDGVNIGPDSEIEVKLVGTYNLKETIKIDARILEVEGEKWYEAEWEETKEENEYVYNTQNVKIQNIEIDEENEEITYDVKIKNDGNKQVKIKKLKISLDGIKHKQTISSKVIDYIESEDKTEIKDVEFTENIVSDNEIELINEAGVDIGKNDELIIKMKGKYEPEEDESEKYTIHADILDAEGDKWSQVKWTNKVSKYEYTYNVESLDGHAETEEKTYHKNLENIAEIAETSEKDKDDDDWKDVSKVNVKDDDEVEETPDPDHGGDGSGEEQEDDEDEDDGGNPPGGSGGRRWK